eukprot:Amastigsp_a6114_4.p4 type:complete len:136 gc:universal Amastigsp_a6114_4:938-531(-)
MTKRCACGPPTPRAALRPNAAPCSLDTRTGSKALLRCLGVRVRHRCWCPGRMITRSACGPRTQKGPLLPSAALCLPGTPLPSGVLSLCLCRMTHRRFSCRGRWIEPCVCGRSTRRGPLPRSFVPCLGGTQAALRV